MVIVLGNNEFALNHLPGGKKLLSLGRKYYEWTEQNDGQGTLKRVKRPQVIGSKITRGNYWIYNVAECALFTSGIHISMISEKAEWKAYIVSPSLELKINETCHIAATDEYISIPSKRLVVI